MDALERLQMYSGDLSHDEFSIEEQMNSADDASADLLDGITDNSQPNKIQEVTLEPEQTEQPQQEELSKPEPVEYKEEPMEEPVQEVKVEDTAEREIKEDKKVEDYNYNTERNTEKKRAGRPPKKQNNVGGSNVVYDNIVRNLIEELRKAKHTTQGLDNNTMNVIYDYMQTKF